MEATSPEPKGHFLRHCLTVTGVFESLCCQCGNTVAYSPDMRVLQIAEDSHQCPARKARAAKSG